MIHWLRKIMGPNHPIRLIWHWSKAVLANLIYRFPSRQLICIGVTGTNGKTTTTQMAEHILRQAGKKVAMLSTVEFKINGSVIPNLSKKTTMSPFKTQAFLRQCVKNEIKYVVIESSSHALHQHRLWGIHFQIAALTNITHEHLDYHGTMAAYKNAKKKLFQNVARYFTESSALVLNTADEFFEDFKQIEGVKKITYGMDSGDLTIENPTYSKAGSRFDLMINDQPHAIHLAIPGEFNIENAMAAAGIAISCNIDGRTIQKALQTFKGVPGRMERIVSPKGFEVIVDFALTPDALERLYKTLRETKPNRLIGLIGSCGDRDKEKRPVMGKVVASYCDITIVTDEEPYSENPMSIMEDILAGAKEIKNLGEALHLIDDRYEAIEFAIKEAVPGDLIVVTGMGCFTTRTLNHGPIEWDEREVVREIIQKNVQ